MIYSSSDRMFLRKAEGSEVNRNPLHNTNPYTEDESTEIQANPEGGRSGTSSAENDHDGTWGEQDVGGPVNLRHAMQDYEDMRKQITNLSRQRSRSRSQSSRKSGTGPSGLRRTVTAGSRASQSLSRPATNEYVRPPPEEIEAQLEDRDVDDDNSEVVEEGEDFALGDFLRDGHFEKRTEGESAKKIGVVWKNLNVRGVGATTTFVKTIPQAVMGTFGPDLYKLLARFIKVLPQPGANDEERTLIRDFTGVVRDGEMLLVLGRPGSGCSTFLKVIANKRDGYAGISGDVFYGGIPAEEQVKSYRGEVNYNEEDDQHFPTLTVEQTLEFSLLNKTTKHERGSIPVIVTALLKMFGISHTRHTLVGDAYTRGVSGGERKRVSIAETLATKSTVVAWDNSTRGLDASTALDYANSLRVMTDISHRTTLVTLYQAGEGIYELMDKVLVIDEGKMVYQGPAREAKAYFESIGYYCPPRQTTADFLTACTDPKERRFRDDFNGSIPKGSTELEAAFKSSQAYKAVLEDVERYERLLQETDHADARQFKESVQEAKSKRVSKRSSYTVSFFRQVMACTKREIYLTLGDRITLYTKFFIVISMSLIVSSLFYGQSLGTSGAFSRGGSCFFSVLFLGWLQLGELMKAVSGRSIIARHNDYAFYRPSAVVIARVIQDFPSVFALLIPFTVTIYFMAGLDVEAGKFFIYALLVYASTICITAMYRMFAALSPSIDDAVRFSGTGLNLLILFTGYAIPKTQLINKYIWFGWLTYVNPVSYVFEAIMANEFSGRIMACESQMIVPNGPSYTDPAYQGCNIVGAKLGSLQVNGSDYISESFGFSRSNLWRNFGVVIAFTIVYILITAIASEVFNFAASGGGALEFKRSKAAKKMVSKSPPADAEKAGVRGDDTPQSGGSSDTMTDDTNDQILHNISGSESIFTWHNVEYTVPYLGGDKKLLNRVSGYAKPGCMVALVGASGAGKTTLLNTFAQRQTTGVVTGDMFVDGRPLGPEFQRGTGFCEQMDLHDGTSTVREALEFSAVLRQDRAIPREEKIAYVESIIDILELREMQDALIRTLGVEQRKRVTIGVELAAKPNLLLFLDEPTSGLDSQSAYSIVRFLKKLSKAGQAIICTIHQPSSVLFQEFDMVLALNPGGNTFYFGPVGENGQDIVKYFGDRGVKCPPNKNVAEFILETAAKGGNHPSGKRINWNEEWFGSEQAKEVEAEIQRIHVERGKVAPPEKNSLHEFASPVWTQTKELTTRMFVQYWRDPSYAYGKLFVAVIVGIFNGFTFWQLGNTVQDMQNRMFTAFLIILIPPTVVNSVVPKFYQNRALWEAREYPSRIYGWVAFCTANVVAEIPIAIVSATIYWVLWYWAAGLPTDSSTAGYVYLMTLLFFMFQDSWGQWICAFAPSFTVISNVLPFFFVTFSLFNGVVRPYGQMNVFWRYFLYYCTPSTYWIGGVISSTLAGVAIECAENEQTYYNPPAGQTCAAYTADYISSMGGYLSNPDATSNCGYCAYTSGEQYMLQLNLEPKDKWGYFGIFLGFCVSNWFLVYFFIYTVRIKGWSFGFGKIFGLVDRLGAGIKGLLRSKKGAK